MKIIDLNVLTNKLLACVLRRLIEDNEEKRKTGNAPEPPPGRLQYEALLLGQVEDSEWLMAQSEVKQQNS